MIELKPCPFCGREVQISMSGNGYDFWWMITHGKYEYKCRVFLESERFCGVGTGEKKALIERWNMRANDDTGRSD